ncbi:hypothetical protein ACODT3_10550 [Streptomyces sp. 4.24]|uniref:hypothetical protein n=1 Tax=Streptomyces tritrimontium TaxID=3406573 RepID=UPI003BB4FC03
MSFRPVAFVVDCDVCAESLEDGDLIARFATQAAAAKEAEAAGWVRDAGGGMVCARDNELHREARQLGPL